MLTALDAAGLILADYAGDPLPGILIERLDIAGVQSVILMARNTKVLLIRGTNERRDWLYNLDFRHDAYETGDTWMWHRGFLAHARIAYAFAKGKGVELVIGHSLGAAAMQIVATSLGVPGIGFASPRALYGRQGPPSSDRIVNYCRPDDIVTGLPFAGLGFHHCGEARWLDIGGRHVGGDHSIRHYLDLLELEKP
jgi:hypothetical protein